MRLVGTLLGVLCCSTLGYAADPLLSQIRLRTDPEVARVRPFESLVVQVLAYGELTDEAGQTKKVRLRMGAADLAVKGPDAGWLSKPFRYQGKEEEPFYEKEGAGLGAVIFGRVQSDFVLKDSVLYTAPAKAGSYQIAADIDGKTASITVTVDPKAPSRRQREKVRFSKERPSRDPYRRLAEHYAPFVAQETWFQPKSDFLARFDLDGDWRGDNNWDSAEVGSSQAYVYYAAMETDTHWFLIYNFFHPRAYSDKCVAGTCHENDNEGAVVTVEKDGSQYGRLIVMETLAHNNVYSYRADRRIKKGVHSPDGKIETYEQSHPVVFIEAGGHGVYGSTGSHSRYSISRDQFGAGTGVTYVYKGVAERPRHGNDRKVGYELLSIYDHWWVRAQEGQGRQDRTFDAYYAYQPYGGRPRSPHPEIAGSFLGRKFGSNKAKPFGGWHDRRTRKKKVLATGQWALDPAYAVSQNLRIPGRFSLDYVFNPYLGIGKPPAPSRSRILSKHLENIRLVEEIPRADESPGGETQAAGPREPAGVELRSDDNDPKRYNRHDEGRFEFRGRIDGTVVFRLRGDRVFAETTSGRPLEVDRFSFSQPLPAVTLGRVEVEQKDGRGKIVVLERPWEGNHFTAVLQVSDPKRSDDRYHFRLHWKR